jgi:hypothetical protein
MTEIDLSAPETQEKIRLLKEKLGVADENVDTTGAAEGADFEAPSPVTGKDVNWDDYDLQPGLAHLYPRAELRETDDGLKWTVELDEFYTVSKSYHGNGVNKDGTPIAMGDFITSMVNGPEKWRIATVMPNGAGAGAILFQRKSRMILPDPMISLPADTSSPTNEELKGYEDAALKWAGGENGQPDNDGESSEEITAS